MAGIQQCWLAFWVHAARVSTDGSGHEKAWKFRSGRHARQQYGVSKRHAYRPYRQWLTPESYSSHFGISETMVAIALLISLVAVFGVSSTLCCKTGVTKGSPMSLRAVVAIALLRPISRSSVPTSGLRLVALPLWSAFAGLHRLQDYGGAE